VEHRDVVIVGGGPAGSSCAWGLREAGLDVVLWDRQTFPRDKVCAGWITPPILGALEIDPLDYAKDHVLQPIRGFGVGRLGNARAEADCAEVVSYGIRRCEFDAFLLERARVPTRLGQGIRSLRRVANRIVVNEALAARVVVGAGGHFCPVARWLGAAPGAAEPAVLAREVEFALDVEQQEKCPVAGELPELFFTEDLKGYGWLVRKGDYLNVGLGRQDPRAFPAHLERFLANLERAGLLPPRLPHRLVGHAYLLYETARRPLSEPGVLLVGDAAGLAYARSGEGIRPAVETGLMAARAIRDGCLEAYDPAVQARFGSRSGRPGLGLTGLLPQAWRGPVGGRFLGNAWFARHVVVDRWFLHRNSPPLEVV